MIICHRTGSATNPYVVINVSIRAWQHGHQTHPALNGRNDILLKDPAAPGEKLPVADCVTTPATTSTPTTTTIVDVTSPSTTSVPVTTAVNQPVVIVVHTTPNTEVTVEGAGVRNEGGALGTVKTLSNEHGRATIKAVPTKPGVLTVKAANHVIKRMGVLGAHTSGASLTG